MFSKQQILKNLQAKVSKKKKELGFLKYLKGAVSKYSEKKDIGWEKKHLKDIEAQISSL